MLVRGLYAIAFLLLLWVGYLFYATTQAYGTLENSDSLVTYGASPDVADVTILAFVDYASSFSHDINAPLQQAVKDDGRARVIFVPTPHPSLISVRAAKLVMTGQKQGRGLELHDAAMRNKRPLTDEIAAEIATGVGLDGAALVAASRGKDIAAALKAAFLASQAIKIEVTPSFVANRKTILRPHNEALEYADFVALIANARAGSGQQDNRGAAQIK